MHRDKKIGFALGILLIGIVAAFFFRNEPDPFAELPPLDDPAALDGQIAEKSIGPYTEEASPAPAQNTARGQANQWELPEIYRPNKAERSAETGLFSSPAAPAPINLEEPVPVEPSSPNGVIEVRNPFGEPLRDVPRAVDEKLPGNEAWTTVPKRPETAAKPEANVVKARQEKAEVPRTPLTTYQIQKGDTLSVLAEKHLGSSRRYMEIYEANRDKLRNPDDIQVGMTIRIPARVKYSGQGVQKAPPANSPAEPPNRYLPSSEEAGRFRPFSRSPLGPVRY